MTTPSNGLGSSPPIPSTPPKTIFVDSSNEDVKLWVWHCLRRNDVYLDEIQTWELAKKVKGTGDVVLAYNKEDWEKEVPGWGQTIYISLQLSQKYVMDTIFAFGLAAQTLLLLVVGGSGAVQIIKKENFRPTKDIGIAFIIYTFILRVLYTVFSSKWAHRNKRFPGCLKLSRKGDQSFWKDFAGIPK